MFLILAKVKLFLCIVSYVNEFIIVTIVTTKAVSLSVTTKGNDVGTKFVRK